MEKRPGNWLGLLGKAGLLVCSLMMTGVAQGWPDRPLKMIVPFPAGGINDTVARLTAGYLGNELGATIVVENRGGAGGTIGTTAAVNSTADGYTILLGASSTIAVAPNLYRNLDYAPERDLVPVGGIGSAASMLVVAVNSRWHSLNELVVAGKKMPGSINYGSAGAGTSHHIKTELLQQRTGARWTHVPYRGGAPAMTDLMGGQIDFLIEPLPTALPYVESGRVRPLGVTTMKRSPLAPKVQTFDEQGVAGYDATLWFGLFVPNGVDERVVGQLDKALRHVFAKADVRQDFEKRGVNVYTGSREQFGKFVASEIRLWGDVIRKADIPVQ